MPFSADTYRDPDLRVIRYWGDVSLADCRAQFTLLRTPGAGRPGMPTLVDLCDMTSFALTMPDMLALRDRLAERYAGLASDVRLAMVATGSLGFGIARMFQTVCSDIPRYQVEIVDTLAEGMAFLGLAESSVRGGPPGAGRSRASRGDADCRSDT